MQIKLNLNNFARVSHSLAACQRHTLSSPAVVIGLSNNDVISLRSYAVCVAFVARLETPLKLCIGSQQQTADCNLRWGYIWVRWVCSRRRVWSAVRAAGLWSRRSTRLSCPASPPPVSTLPSVSPSFDAPACPRETPRAVPHTFHKTRASRNSRQFPPHIGSSSSVFVD